eukprot:TRINITY_DN6678_c0_g1_i1.p1 TRINITY_DN6678_c0_g1~~TRINITY_DN6678_c0_g1_i1.p1  ORF type:complete len:467 (+),score=163.51 TRINITY_DN6678_c0_g1_i1:166-1566(+)
MTADRKEDAEGGYGTMDGATKEPQRRQHRVSVPAVLLLSVAACAARVYYGQRHVDAADVRSKAWNSLAMSFWAFSITAAVPVVEVSIAFFNTWKEKRSAGLQHGETRGDVLKMVGEGARDHLVSSFDPLDAIIFQVYLFGIHINGWDSVTCWIGTVLCLSCSLLGPVGRYVDLPAAILGLRGLRAPVGYVGIVVLTAHTMYQMQVSAGLPFVLLVTGWVFALTIASQVARCLVGWQGLVAMRGGLRNVSEEDLDVVHDKETDAFDKLLCAVYLFVESSSHDALVFVGAGLGAASTLLGLLSMTQMGADGALGGLVRFRPAVGLVSVALIIVNSVCAEVPTTWPGLSFLVTIIIAVVSVGTSMVELARQRRPGARAAGVLDEVGKQVTDPEREDSILSLVDPLDTLLLTMYIFGTSAPGHLVWIGCISGVVSSAAKFCDGVLPYRGLLGSVTIVVMVATSMVAHFGF